MPEDVAVAPPPAESSPAEPQSRQPQEVFTVPTDPEEYAEWRQTGKQPEKKPSSGDSATPKKPPSTEDSATSKKTPSSGDSATPHLKRQGYGDQRREVLNDEIRELIAQRDRLKQEIEGKQPAQRDVKPAAESSNAQPAQPQDPQRPKKPNQDDFNSWSDYEKAKDKYDEDLADYKAGQKIQEYVRGQEQQARQAAIQVKLDSAKERYGDEAEPLIHKTGMSLFENKNVHPGVKAAIGRSDVMVDALYVMGTDPQELESFTNLASKDPIEALRKWFTFETLVKAELARNPGKAAEPNGDAPMRDEDGRFVSAKPPAKIRHAPAPPTELGGNASPPGDERDRAAASGDVRKFFNEGNRRDLARWKGQL